MSKQTEFALRIMPFVLAMAIVLVLPILERLAFPVVRDFVVTSMLKEPSAVMLSGYMRKARDCEFIGVSVTAVSGSDYYDVPIYFLDGGAQNSTRPTGTQGWGPWRITLPAVQADEVRLRSTHRCHPFWTVDTELAIIPLRAH